jgi:hypothetical protein
LSNETPNNIGDQPDLKKRKTLKTLGATVGAGTMAGFPAMSSATHQLDGAAGAASPAESTHHNLTINIQLNREDLDDWVLMENLTEQPLVVRAFEPRYVQYQNKVLDLHSLLSRQQRGKEQLEIWPNHAWTHSVRGATRAQHPLRSDSGACQVSDADQCRSIQLAAFVHADGDVTLQRA